MIESDMTISILLVLGNIVCRRNRIATVYSLSCSNSLSPLFMWPNSVGGNNNTRRQEFLRKINKRQKNKQKKFLNLIEQFFVIFQQVLGEKFSE